ncbi:PQQ-dependent sugar dehydrogenase [Microvirga sp. 2TAF3]|uniref:PQQ-dependent sugar dehydrogenase n=1 Tax=Microvirga sp. 2TAF3 TaxID=3233014 RepID=UPI003F94564D
MDAKRLLALGGSAVILAILSVSQVPAQKAPPQPDARTTDAMTADQELGRHIQIDADRLPPPKAGPIVANAPLVVPYRGQTLHVLEGFTATPFATRLENPRRLLVLPNGDVIVAEQRPGSLILLRDSKGEGRADQVERYADGFNLPYGLAWRDGEILVADQDGIWRVPHKLGAVRPGDEEPKPISQTPSDRRRRNPNVDGKELITQRGVFGSAQDHINRDLKIDPKTGALFVGVGSSGNIKVDSPVKATIQRFDPDGSNQSTVASGMRNPTSLAFEPGTGGLYAIVQERDGMGDDLVPDYLTRVEKGAFYGWPYAYIGPHPQPGFAQRAPDKVKATVKPDMLFRSHSSLLDIVFYTADQFPPEYRGSAFVALKGSWNRSEPTGYKIVRVPFKDGRPVGWYENFATGFWAAGRNRAEVWGRPAALAIAKDGSLLVGDDTGGTIWRISYTGTTPATGSVAPRRNNPPQP